MLAARGRVPVGASWLSGQKGYPEAANGLPHPTPVAYPRSRQQGPVEQGHRAAPRYRGGDRKEPCPPDSRTLAGAPAWRSGGAVGSRGTFGDIRSFSQSSGVTR